jgi:hypothetical protein
VPLSRFGHQTGRKMPERKTMTKMETGAYERWHAKENKHVGNVRRRKMRRFEKPIYKWRGLVV